jgi:hypothetical protein
MLTEEKTQLTLGANPKGRSANAPDEKQVHLMPAYLAHPDGVVRPEEPTKQQVIHFIDALAGQHKTQHIIEQATSLAGDREKLLILVPTLLLAESVKTRIEHEMAGQNLTAIINLKAFITRTAVQWWGRSSTTSTTRPIRMAKS